MASQASKTGSGLKVGVIVTFFLALAGVVVAQLGVIDLSLSESEGLSGMVSVRGAVKVSDLGLSGDEVQKINRAVAEHGDVFTQVDLFLDVKGQVPVIEGKTVLVMAMVLETNGDCEVRSWSRKVKRDDLVSQIVVYMNKAAAEYAQFQKYPDVKQNFKCLYI